MMHLIECRADLTVMTRSGWSYEQLSTILGQLLAESLIARLEDGKLGLTAAGRTLYQSHVHRMSLGGSSTWIAPLKGVRIPKLDADEVYVPSKSEVKSLDGRRR